MIKTKSVLSCLWCGSQDISNQNSLAIVTRDFTCTSEQRYKYVKCDICNSLNLLDQPIESELKKIYSSTSYDPYITKRNVVINETDKLLSGCLKFSRQLKILDYGAGSGDYLYKMAKIFPGAILYAVDFDTHAAQKRLCDLSVNIISPHQYMSEKYQFDHINISHCLEHLPNPIQVFSKLTNELNESGILIVRTPISDSFSLKFFQGYWFGLEAPRHFTVPSKKIFEELLPSNFALTLLAKKYYDSPIIFMRSFNYCIPNRLPFRKILTKVVKLAVSKFSKLAGRYELSSKAEFFYKK